MRGECGCGGECWFEGGQCDWGVSVVEGSEGVCGMGRCGGMWRVVLTGSVSLGGVGTREGPQTSHWSRLRGSRRLSLQ